MRTIKTDEYKVYCRECDTMSVVKLKSLGKTWVKNLDRNCDERWFKAKCPNCKESIYLNPECMPEQKKTFLANIEKRKIENIKLVFGIIQILMWAYALYMLATY